MDRWIETWQLDNLEEIRTPNLVLLVESFTGRLEHLLTVTMRAFFSKLYLMVKKSFPSLGPSSFSEKLTGMFSS